MKLKKKLGLEVNIWQDKEKMIKKRKKWQET